MSTRTYPAFCSLNQPELELLSMSVPLDQAINIYPSLDEVPWHDNLTATFLFEQFLTAAAPYHSIASLPAGDLSSVIQQTISPGESSTRTRELTGPVRLKRTRTRVVHACDYCRHQKKKCSGEKPMCLSCLKLGRVCAWTPIKTTKYRPSRKRNAAKLYQIPSRTCELDPMTDPRQLTAMQDAATLVSSVRNTQAANIPPVEFPVQIVTSQTRTVDFDLGLSHSRVWSPPPPPCPPYFYNTPSCAHPLRTRQRLRDEYLCHQAVATG
ncbi:uncharacterized protein EDB91DRAFT_1124710 [Suillus paluster]|uniref:uncharacterized protein n=1 Tax=Suillus paluster TaxID=48578 RepID=UPI001B8792ED|nr:uncharacterized protein EDB91DRAFT_1124710 [Suillus paluster]KAG1744143.1 hypothetical protein EDB91DRAFT_1124710 [Suillus paluster]